MRRVRLQLPGHVRFSAVLVDGRRSYEQVEAELRQRLLLGPVRLGAVGSGVSGAAGRRRLWAAGRQGSHLALRAAASCRRSFVLCGATEEELESVGLEPRGEGEVRSRGGFLGHMKLQ